MLWTMLLSFIAFSLIFVWLLGMRYRIEVLQDAVGDQELEVSLAERWSEDTDLVGAGARPTGPSTGAAPARPGTPADVGGPVRGGGA